MANILFIDTAAPHTHVAVGDADGCLNELKNELPNQQAASLNDMIARLFAQVPLELKNIDAIAVNAGPGSYTGLRVGLGVAKGLCFALDKPLMLFNKLELLLHRQPQQALVVLKARTGEGFAIAGNGTQIDLPAQHIFYNDFPFDTYKDYALITDDDAVKATHIAAADLGSHILDIALWNKQAQQRWNTQDFDELAYAEPFYLKAAFTTEPKQK
ncbi:tRNA threonylcarbamoyladenosine biosynthesis protein TsaB [compost metagenome]